MTNLLSASVQRNCHIADARYGADYSMCIYLMKMREYFRWERSLPFGSKLPNEELGDWLTEREQLWNDLAREEFLPIEIDGEAFDPFDVAAINSKLAPSGLVYSGGLGHNAQPHFFLGDLERRDNPTAYQVWLSGREYARDLTAPPAMSQGESIYIRRESLYRMLWEKLENWRWSRPDNPMGRAFAGYEFDQQLEDSLAAMTEREIDTLLYHEIGEIMAGRLLEGDWNQMLLDLNHTAAALMARGVRDNLADCLSTLPYLLRQEATGSIHFIIGNLSSMRKEIFPSLPQAYDEWLVKNDAYPLQQVVARGRDHWLELANRMLEIHRTDPDQSVIKIKDLVQSQAL